MSSSILTIKLPYQVTVKKNRDEFGGYRQKSVLREVMHIFVGQVNWLKYLPGTSWVKVNSTERLNSGSVSKSFGQLEGLSAWKLLINKAINTTLLRCYLYQKASFWQVLALSESTRSVLEASIGTIEKVEPAGSIPVIHFLSKTAKSLPLILLPIQIL